MTPLAALFRRIDPDPRRDGELLAAFLAEHDEPAFAELVRRHGPLVWGACRRVLPDEADAEDAFQATFLVLVRRAGRLTAATTIGPWLLTVAALTARNVRRKNARRLARAAELHDVP
ncbi:sigma-70 family RNA polymerase sigma factor, partial [bacterium]|nr:sigma-70 family RNA polymerase sigma factor [bacterium]